MLSDSERRRLEELEAQLRADDPTLAATLTDRHRTAVSRRRGVAIGLATTAGIATVVGLVIGNVVTVVVALCVLGLAGGIWTWQPRATGRGA